MSASTRLTIPPELKRMTQYIRRAEELDHDKRAQSRIVAYYCRQYAVQTGIQLSNSASARTCLSELLSSLETEKKAMSVFSTEECAAICQKFALEIFEKADEEDRAGSATKGTAKTFYAAAVFLKIIEQFYDKEANPMDEDVTEKWKYARWKAMDINKAITEGRDVTPGGHGEMQDFQDVQQINDTTAPAAASNEPDIIEVQENKNNDNNAALLEVSDVTEEGTEVDLVLGLPPSYPVGLPDTPSIVPPPPSPPPKTATSPIKSPPTKQQSSSISTSTNNNDPSSSTSQEALADALELTRFALAALEAKDTDVGRNRLEQALQCLNRINTKGESSPKKGFFDSFKKTSTSTPPEQSTNSSEDHNVLFMTKSAIAALEKRDAGVGKDRIKQALNSMNHE